MVVVTERNFDSLVSPDMREEYWYRVRRALADVIGVPSGLADGFREATEKLQGDALIWAFRDDPLQVAADLAGHELTSDDAARYEQLFPEPIAQGQPVWSQP